MLNREITISGECKTGSFECTVDFSPIKGGKEEPIVYALLEKSVDELTKSKKNG